MNYDTRQDARKAPAVRRSWTRLVFAHALLLTVLTNRAAATNDCVVIENWTAGTLGGRGIPVGWTGQIWGQPHYDFTVVLENEERVLHLQSRNESSTISKAITGRVLLPDTPLLEWQWKALRLPTGGDWVLGSNRAENSLKGLERSVTG